MKILNRTERIKLPPFAMSGHFPDVAEEKLYRLEFSVPCVRIYRDYDYEDWFHKARSYAICFYLYRVKLFPYKLIITKYIYEQKKS